MRVEPCAGTTMNVAQWLNAIDLGEYEALFREHAIDAEVLPELTDADLEKFGVPFGHRKRLIKAIAKLRSLSAGTGRDGSPSAADARSGRLRRTAASHRDVLRSRRLDEPFRPRARRRGLAQSGQRLPRRSLGGGDADSAGMSLKKLGDGLMALFGYPHRAGERRRTRGSRRAGHPARARRTQRAGTPARARRSSSPASALRPGRWWSTQRAKCSATRPMSPRGSRRWPSRERCLITATRSAADRGTVRRRGSRRACAERRARADDALSHHSCERRRAGAAARGR